jgi:hypothetical protein
VQEDDVALVEDPEPLVPGDLLELVVVVPARVVEVDPRTPVPRTRAGLPSRSSAQRRISS